ncbi:hypothetical protein EYZ11_002977 [Aspergillus tanneri]|uniref:Uncharacterized protein n=1 Tax=Aspergillus tanneri TaxID=1220188 RepID=A0A4V3UQ41_9EURO|nr:hypothetical protein EYZ11_002977 [Aspergillus tanneri]
MNPREDTERSGNIGASKGWDVAFLAEE